MIFDALLKLRDYYSFEEFIEFQNWLNEYDIRYKTIKLNEDEYIVVKKDSDVINIITKYNKKSGKMFNFIGIAL